MNETEDELVYTLCASSEAVLERLKAISVAAATSVEKHVASSDFVIEIPFVLTTCRAR